MKTRLGIFVLCLLLLPLAGLWLSGTEWSTLTSNSDIAGSDEALTNTPATLLTTLMFVGYLLLSNYLVKTLTGNNPFKLQRTYFLWMGAAGAVVVWLLAYLNLFTANWVSQPDNLLMQLLLYTPLFALLAPAVLSTRALLASFSGVLKRLARGIIIPAPDSATAAYTLALLAAFGLLGGAAWPAQLFWLFWLAPLLLLVALQLLWGESTIFSGLKSGDWGRLICAALAGLIVGNFGVMAYQANGGLLAIKLIHSWFAQPGYMLFGLLCLQLGDVVAENWRGKQRTELFKQKKKFPIPVVVKKN